MTRIRKLSADVVNKIAAGEVVERPASVVRELVDNAVDAGADDICVSLEGGGIELIRVSDNGSGMEKDDALMAFECHATSKIQNASDLVFINTMGFRGEALSSIASVSRVKLITRTKDGEAGTQVVIHGGVVKGVSAVAAPLGTEIEVAGLFYNIPARRKFLKQPATEELRVRQWLQQAALAWPGIRLRLVVDGREILSLARKATAQERGEGLIKGPCVSFERRIRDMKLAGILGHPGVVHGGAQFFAILVNRRLVSDRMILRAVKDGFGAVLKDRELPVGFLSLELPAQGVDVNVHPQKSEVRFGASSEVFSAVRSVVEGTLKEFRAPVQFIGERSAQPNAAMQHPPAALAAKYPLQDAEESATVQLGLSERLGNTLTDIKEMEGFKFSKLRFLGQALSCYLICEQDEKLYAVDMHAAHERYNYNLIRNNYRTRRVESQQLLVPQVVEVGEQALLELAYSAQFLEQMGIEIEQFGASKVLVRAIPAILVDANIELILQDFFSEGISGIEAGAIDKEVDRIAARIACHASIRSGYEMSKEEVYALFERLDQSEFSAACPHGRPVIVSFSRQEVESWFGRDR